MRAKMTLQPKTRNTDEASRFAYHSPLRHSPFAIRRYFPAFTLIELILVMTVLTIAVSLTAPALANFFRGRTLESEARRLLALTRQGQSRAVSEGIPMELWLDAANGSYGLEAELSYEPTDPKAIEFTLDKDVQVEVLNQSVVNSSSVMGRTTAAGSAGTMAVAGNHPNLPKIRFLPDGSISESSPQKVRVISRDGTALLLAQSRNGLNYEIATRNN